MNPVRWWTEGRAATRYVVSAGMMLASGVLYFVSTRYLSLIPVGLIATLGGLGFVLLLATMVLGNEDLS